MVPQSSVAKQFILHSSLFFVILFSGGASPQSLQEDTMIHPTLAIDIAKARQSELVQEIKAVRLPKKVTANHSSIGRKKNR